MAGIFGGLFDRMFGEEGMPLGQRNHGPHSIRRQGTKTGHKPGMRFVHYVEVWKRGTKHEVDKPIWHQPFVTVSEEDRTPRDRSLRGKARVKARKAERRASRQEGAIG